MQPPSEGDQPRRKIELFLVTGKVIFVWRCQYQIATLMERQARYVILVKVDSKDSQTVVNSLIKHASKLPQELYKSLALDRGNEIA